MGDDRRRNRGGELGDDPASVPSIDEWDQDFLNEAIEAMEAIEATSYTNPTTSHPPPPPPPVPTISRTPPTAVWGAFPSNALLGASTSGRREGGTFDFSPPRELSQRFPDRADSPTAEVIEIEDPRRHDARKDKTVERLKRELGRVSKQLNHLEHECIELKKEKTKKDEQLKCAFSQIEAKDVEIQNLKRENLEVSKSGLGQFPLQRQNSDAYTDQAGHCPKAENKCLWSTPPVLERSTKEFDHKSQRANEPSGEFALDYKSHDPKRKNVQTDGICAVSELKRRIMIDNSLTTGGGSSALETTSREIPAPLKCSKTVGIQTDLVQDKNLSALKDVSLGHNIGSKLLAIWGSPISGSPYYKRRGREMVSKLFVTRSADFSVLFRCMNIVSEKDSGFPSDKSFSETALLGDTQSAQSTDATKVSRLYVILMKMNNEIVELHPLLEALVDLCTSNNISVVHRSLRILHAILQDLLSCSLISYRRKNVIDDQSLNGINEYKESDGQHNQIVDIQGYEKAYAKLATSGLFSPIAIPFDLEKRQDQSGSSNMTSLSSEDLVSLFESLRQLVIRYSEEYIRIEAISLMNLILTRSNPYLDRQEFELMTLLETLSHLLRKEVGVQLKREAVRLLFLLLNSPKMLMMICSGGKDGTEHTEIADAQKDVSGLSKEISCIFNGLSECLASTRTGAQELKLRRQIIILLAYIAAYGEPGFKVLLNTVTHEGVNFIESIVRVLGSEMDSETTNPAEAQVLCKERISLMREALILLNRLVSHPAYSKDTLGALTSSNAVASLTVDVANRISQTSRGCWKHNIMKKTKMGAEVIDLARLFRTRVCAFLGENTS